MKLSLCLSLAIFCLVAAYPGRAQSHPPNADAHQAAAPIVIADEREKRSKAENDAIWAALEKRIELFEVRDMPLGETLQKILAQTTIRNHHIEWQSLIDAGVPREKPITMRLQGVPAWRVLDLILAEAGGIDTRVEYEPIDGVLHISTAEAIGQYLTTGVYPVGDIVSRDVPAIRDRIATTRPANEPMPGESDASNRAAEHFREAVKRMNDAAGASGEEQESEERPVSSRAARRQRLMDIMQQSILPDCWAMNGGTSTITAFDDCLVVRSSPKVQRAICKLLRELRVGIAETPDQSRLRTGRP